jgi:MurNAc alpha-1-phosphate uridylyltransferase
MFKSGKPRAIVFAAGLGTRMRPLTNDRPKGLVEVAGRTLIDHMLDQLEASGVHKVIVNTYHFAEKLISHLDGRKGRLPEIVLSREDNLPEPLETEGGLINALPLMGEGLILTCNADAIWMDETAIKRAIEAYDPEKMDGLLLLAKMENTVGFDGAGDFFMDKEGRLTRRGDAKSAPFAYAGVQITRTGLFKDKPLQKRSLAKTWFEEWAPKGRLYGIVLDGMWLHVGDPAARDEAEKIFIEFLNSKENNMVL